jgi:hypothetical protein
MTRRAILRMSFWRLGEEGRLRYVWRPLAQQLNAVKLLHAKKATKALILTPNTKYEYSLCIRESLRPFQPNLADIITVYAGKPTAVHISITPPISEPGSRETLSQPYTRITTYPGLTCITVLAPGTVIGVRQATLTPLRIADLRIQQAVL